MFGYKIDSHEKLFRLSIYVELSQILCPRRVSERNDEKQMRALNSATRNAYHYTQNISVTTVINIHIKYYLFETESVAFTQFLTRFESLSLFSHAISMQTISHFDMFFFSLCCGYCCPVQMNSKSLKHKKPNTHTHTHQQQG